MKQEELMGKFKEEFKKTRQELKFKSSLDEIERIFFIKDYIAKEGFVSTKLSRTICHRIVDLFNNWGWYLHGLIIPNPSSVFSMTENQFFDEKEKAEIGDLMNRIMEFSSRNSIIGLTEDKSKEAKFIDDSVNFWKTKLNPKLIEIMKKTNTSWKGKIK